jgi:hypothetical protein
MSACSSLWATRPSQEFSDTAAAIKAAHEVSAETKAPELYRQSQEWFFRAKREYKFKNFGPARDYAKRARYYAEQAEFVAIKNGGTPDSKSATDPRDPLPMPPPPPPEPEASGAPLSTDTAGAGPSNPTGSETTTGAGAAASSPTQVSSEVPPAAPKSEAPNSPTSIPADLAPPK